MANEEKITELKTQRASTKGCITRIKNFVDQKGETLSPPELECRLGILESYFKQVLAFQTSIDKLLPDDANEGKIRGELEELYCATKSKLLSLMAGFRKSSLLADTSAQIVVTSPSINKLPKLRLPQFSGKYSDFPNFFGCFQKLVHQDDSLSGLEKFNHLISCLSGPALCTIKAFEITEDNYQKALDRIRERYDNKYLIFQEHVVDLFNLPKISKNSALQLRNLIDNTTAHLSALRSLGSFEDITNAFIIYIINSKLDSESQASWEEKMDLSKLPSWNQCAQSLSRRCQYLESRDAKLHTSENWDTFRKNKPIHSRSSSTKLISLATTHSACAFCNQTDHKIYKCSNFIKLSVTDRLREVKRRALCLNCLYKGHSLKKCSVQHCRVCSMPHHTLLHRFSPNLKETAAESTSRHNELPETAFSSSSQNDTPAANTALKISQFPKTEEKSHVFLATAIVKIRDRYGHFHQARALLDSASQLNFVTENLAQTLGLKRDKVETSIMGIGDTSSKVRYSTQAVIQSRVNKFEIFLKMFILGNITGVQPEQKIVVDSWKIPENIELADPHFFEPQKVELLLGADHFFQLLSVGQIQLGENMPTLQKTLFGWIVSGRCSNPFRAQGKQSCSLACDIGDQDEMDTTHDSSLVKIVEKFWNEDCVDASPATFNDEQLECELVFSTTFKRLPNGRFMVKLPFKNSPEKDLGKSYEIAKNRFYSLERRLTRNSDLKAQYSDFLKDYLSADHMEKIPITEVPPVHFFMPHQCVLRPESSTTKLRVVFDASCRTTSNKSLNDLLMVGPTVQNDVYSIILRFRCYKFALTADISAMYRQILVYPQDRNFQLILWRQNPNEDLQIFRLKTVTYGTASAPFLATRCLIQLGQGFSATLPVGSRIIKEDFYMDDLITGANTKEELHRIRTEVEYILSSAHFKLRKWCSNDEDLLFQIPEEDREKPLRINSSDVIKTLGIAWEPTSDEFQFHFKASNTNSRKVTKRTILSQIARIFDPLGLISPIVVKAKIFLQELWILGLHWDESIPLELENRWRDYIFNFTHLHDLKIPRLVLSTEKKVRTEIHGFADASTRAYGCCIYLRCIDSQGIISVKLLTAKSKVAPISTVRSLPSLELCAALLLSRLLERVRTSLPRSLNPTYLWTDSEIVLDWLACHPSTWKTFVANRVAEIQRLTSGTIWRHVNSKANPADIVSRGVNVAELLGSIWFHGPSFLQLSPEAWPPSKDRHCSKTTLERRNIKSVLVCVVTDIFLEQIYAYSDFLKTCRRFAFVLRFINNLKLKRDGSRLVTGQLSATEIDDALLRLVWSIQQKEFADVIQALNNRKEPNPKSGIIKLSPFLDDGSTYRLLRVGGRLKNANIPYECKCPILLPRNNVFVKSYVKYLHYKNFHAGPLALVSIVRQRFWIVNAREYARKIVRNCLHCFKYRPRLMQQIMGNLPKGRVNMSLPFTHCGVDFCGPFRTTYNIRGKKLSKSYVAIFICLATRAVHIEVVSDLTSDAFIAALKRFIGRRNLCKHLYCDNATNFVGAKRQLEEFRQAFFQQKSQGEVINWCSNNSIEFHHIPPRAPHFGGIWEAAIKSAKTLLFKTFQGSMMTFEELTTVMVQIEAVLNSRPITPLSSDPNDEEALTPAHFLNQAPIDSFVEPNLNSKKIFILRRWQRTSALLQHFWRRWTKEYLCHLQARSKWHTSHPNIRVGSLVLVHQDDLPPYKWRLGRILSTTSGPDGKVRVVEIKAGGGVIKRAIHKVAPIPIDED